MNAFTNSARNKNLEPSIEEKKKGFRIHSLVYLCVNTGLVTLNLLLVPEFLWFFFPLFGWGFGLTMHYLFGVKRLERSIDKGIEFNPLSDR